MHPVLRDIITYKKSTLEGITLSGERRLPAPLELTSLFENDQVNIIAEIKFSSPKAGQIAVATSPALLANEYYKSGARAISVLTEERFFKGSLDYLSEIKKAYPKLPLLMKDFILEEVQIEKGFEMGADGVLLIAGLHPFKKLQKLYQKVLALGMTPLLEIHDQGDLAKAVSLQAPLIGINNRNLSTMEISLETSQELVTQIPYPCCLISESGISNSSQVGLLSSLGFNGFLIGSHFMKTAAPALELKGLLEACHAN
ncbi:MAG: indole-3-glycerol-phosphate synthase [Halobacteriovoraceae bacterium]|jgi:indole-3-glycerol phosphate synthase|nr:indole-3-glycerol-phosphate synthase [Halobacteriovoraceae bacterium]